MALTIISLCWLFLLPNIYSSPIEEDVSIPRATTVNYRLPTSISPINYKVELTLSSDVFDNSIYNGVAIITLQSSAVVQEINLHALNLTIPSNGVRIASSDEQVISVTNTNFVSDPDTDILTLNTSVPLNIATTYTLTIYYTAFLTVDEMYGFYKSSYVDENGDTKYLATTQLQPTYARRVFPCFDEPSFKASFDITLSYPSNYSAIGNTPILRNTTNSGITTTVFATTPIMPTYLIAFIISDFTCTSSVDIGENVPHRVCSREEASSTRQLAIDVGPQLVWAMENFTNVKYSFSGIGKIDQVAIPDFAAGAMENWGLITYRETALLWDNAESSNRYQQRVATVVAHELAHMWFGDLVTTHWWSDSFLNEGFATYFEYFATASVLSTWELEKQFVIEQIHEVLVIDALITTQALSQEVSSPPEVLGRFTDISYNKGGAIFRMVENFMGTEAFKNGINRYLNTYSFSNSRPTDLWNSLNFYSTGLPASLPSIMENWVTRPGFPLLNVWSNGTDVIILQKRYLLNGTDNTQWYVPISYTRSNDTQKFSNTLPKNWVSPGSKLLIKNVLDGVEWFIINNQQTGYYRVDYDDILWNKIAAGLKKLNFDGIHEINRAQIVDDLFNMARLRIRSYSRVFELTSFLAEDVSYYPWYAAFGAFSHMLQRTGNARLRTQISNHILNLMQKIYEDVPFSKIDDENQIYSLKKIQVLTWACRLGHEDCISYSTQAFSSYKTSGQRPHPNLRTIVYCNALRNSSRAKEDWDFLWQKFNETKIATEQVTIISALGCTTDKVILNSYLQKSITPDSGIRKQDALSVFSAVYTENPESVDIAIDFLIANYQQIDNHYGSMNSLLSLINGLVGRLTTEGQLNKLTEFVSTGDLEDSLKASAEAALITAKTNLEWTQAFEEELTEYYKLEPDSATSINVGFVTVVNVLLITYLFY